MREKLNDLQSKILAIKTEIRDVRSARKTKDEVLDDAKSFVSHEASEFIRRAGFDSIGENHDLAGRSGISRAAKENVFGLLCAVFPDRIESLIISNVSDQGLRLSDNEREKKLASLAAKLNRLERDEETEIERLEASGHFILRRRDANPYAVLGMDEIPN